MAKKPRDYQDAAVQSVFEYFENNDGNPIIAMPTGTGKSIVIGEFLRRAFASYPMTRAMLLTHVKELIEQNFARFMDLWPAAPAGIYSSGLGLKQSGFPITFGGIGSVVNVASKFGFIDFVIVDEAHLISPTDATQYRKFFQALRAVNKNLKIIGLTATPYRLGQGRLTEGENALFTDICFDLTTKDAFNWLISQGYLSTLIPKKTILELDSDGISMRGGEFSEKEVQLAVDKDTITRAAIEEIMACGMDRNRCLIFASGVDHAIHIGEILKEYGISHVVIHSKMPDKERDEAIRKLRSGEVWCGVNNNVLTTGFDCPEVDLIAVIRFTMSSSLWVQMLGRGTRPVYAPGYDLDTPEGRLLSIEAGGKKNCLALDFGQNTVRLGPVNEPVMPRAKGKGVGTAPVKVCHVCNAYIHASARVCPHCATEFVFAPKYDPKASTAVLISGADLPQLETMAVKSIVISPHIKPGKPAMVRVEYMTKRKKYFQTVCPEHVGFALIKAKEWWRKRTDYPFPGNVEQFLEQADLLRVPTHIKVHVNRHPYPEIVDECWDGSDFGKIAPSDEQIPCYVETKKPMIKLQVPVKDTDIQDDDIPF